MSRLLTLLTFIFMIICLTIPGPVFAQSSIKVMIDGKTISFADAQPTVENGRVLVPFRVILEKLGAEVGFESRSKTVGAIKKDTAILLTINNSQAQVNDTYYQLDVPPRLNKGRTYVPLRFVSEALGAGVNWLPEQRLITITQGTGKGLGAGSNIPTPGTNDKEILGYFAFNSLSALKTNSDILTEIAAAWYTIDGAGNIKGKTNQQVIESAKNENIKNLALIQNLSQGNFSGTVARSFLSDGNRKNAVNNIYNLVKNNNYAGINLDIEFVAASDKDNFNKFVKEVSDKLHQDGKLVTLSIPAKTASTSSWHAAYDYSVLAQYADQIAIMTYDEHWFGGTPGPVASISWVKQVVEYSLKYISRDKLLIGIGYYGYDWGKEGTYVSPQKVNFLIAQYKVFPMWDDTSSSPYFKYVDAWGQSHVVWYENTKSVQRKLDLLNKYQVKGIAIWEIGFLDGNTWESIREGFAKGI